jgi:hypothetical protein
MAIITLNNNSLSSVTALPAGVGGKVLQVVYSENTYTMNTTSTTDVDVLSASGVTWETAITPSSTSSKIIIAANLYIGAYNFGGSEAKYRLHTFYKIGAGSYTDLNQNVDNGIYDYNGGGVSYAYRGLYNYQITPSTTSAVTVKFQVECRSGATVEINYASEPSVCFLYEVAG